MGEEEYERRQLGDNATESAEIDDAEESSEPEKDEEQDVMQNRMMGPFSPPHTMIGGMRGFPYPRPQGPAFHHPRHGFPPMHQSMGMQGHPVFHPMMPPYNTHWVQYPNLDTILMFPLIC